MNKNDWGIKIFVLAMVNSIFLFSNQSFAVFSEEILTDPHLLRNVVQLGNNDFSCTGFFIDKHTVLTAAHCVEDEKGKKNPTMILQFGASGDKVENLLEIGFSQSSKTKSPGEDVAFVSPFQGLTQQSPQYLTTIEPLQIENSNNFSSEDEVCVVGIGESEKLSGPQALRIRCGLRAGIAPGGIIFISDPVTSSQINGPGDSGGPVLKKYPNGTYKVIGILSLGPQKKLSGLFGLSSIATNLLIGPAKDWLNKKWFPSN